MRTIGALIFEGFELLDLYGPLEMFGLLEDEFRIRLVAEDAAPVASAQAARSMPDATFADGESYDVLLIPGGRGTRREVRNEALLGWLREASARAELTTSVCTGAALLARAGLLDGRAATTNKLAFDAMAKYGPKTDWRRRARWVEDGPVMTASGVSAGIDMSLAAIERLVGPEAAAKAALWAEYERNADPDHDPFEAAKAPA
ncbi:MAG: DJ-1/PfpI family protein [Pseudomonadota bacterium]